MHPKDMLLAAILGLAVAHTTYQWTKVLHLSVTVEDAVAEAWGATQAQSPFRPALPSPRSHERR